MNSGRTTSGAGAAVVDATPGNRRGSASSGTMFSGLMNQKRGSLDASAVARRQSFHEMKPTPGFIGKMWHNFTMGHPER